MLNRRRSTSYPAPRSDVFKQGFVSQTKLKDHCEANLRTKPLHFICKCSRALGHCVALCLPTDSCHLSDHNKSRVGYLWSSSKSTHQCLCNGISGSEKLIMRPLKYTVMRRLLNLNFPPPNKAVLMEINHRHPQTTSLHLYHLLPPHPHSQQPNARCTEFCNVWYKDTDVLVFGALSHSTSLL